LKYRLSDKKDPYCLDNDGFNKIVLKFGIAPNFVTIKEISHYIAFTKYQKKNIQPTIYLEFCNFVEILCLIGLESKILANPKKNNNNNVEKLNAFLELIKQKSSSNN